MIESAASALFRECHHLRLSRICIPRCLIMSSRYEARPRSTPLALNAARIAAMDEMMQGMMGG